MPAEPRPAGGFAERARAGLSGTGKVFAGFKEFVSRGNAIELAVGVAVGAAFGAVVQGIANGFIGPLVALVLRGKDLSHSLTWTWLGSQFSLGLVLDALLKFFITAAAIYFAVVLPLNALAKRRARGEETVPEVPAEDVELLREIRDLLAGWSGDGAPGQEAPVAGVAPGAAAPAAGGVRGPAAPAAGEVRGPAAPAAGEVQGAAAAAPGPSAPDAIRE
jgi:large conductance mechanosensitive channel